MNPLTAEDFASVPWGGMAVHEDGRKAVRVSYRPDDEVPWLAEEGETRRWRMDIDMSDDGGWRIMDASTTGGDQAERDEVLGKAVRKRDAVVKQLHELQDALTHRNRQISELEQRLNSGILVSSAREALDAAWELAHEPEDGSIPEGHLHLVRAHSGGFPEVMQAVADVRSVNALCERRLLDPPAPKPEPWETAPFVIWDDDGGTFIAARHDLPDGPVWLATGSTRPLTRDEIAAMNPKPFDPSEVQG